MKRTSWAVLALALLALVAVRARASVVEALTMRQLVAESAVVLVGEVGSRHVHRDAFDRIVTDFEVRVDEGMHGARRGEHRVLRLLGGDLAGLGMRVEGEARTAEGERILLFAQAMTDASGPVLRPTGMGQGLLRLRSVAGVDVVMPSVPGLAVVERGPSGQLVPGAQAVPEPRQADFVLEQVRSLVREVHRGL